MTEIISMAQQLSIPERDRRITVGQGLSDYLNQNGFERVVLLTNIQDALPILTRDELRRHAVPTDAYAGRGPGMALGLKLPFQEMVVHVPSPIFQQEESLLREIASKSGVTFPTLKQNTDTDLEDKGTFVYPFIGSTDMNERFPGRTTPPAERYNNKALMRDRFRVNGMADKLVPGAEIFYRDQDPSVFIQQVIDAVHEYANLTGKNRFILKLAETASGLLSPTVSPDEVKQLQSGRIPNSLLAKVKSMFTGSDGAMFMGDVVLEEFIDYRSDQHTGDFNSRGYLLPNGRFIPLSIGRQICDEKGQYLGMISVPTHNNALVQQIGLHPDVLVAQMGIMEAISKDIFRDGYFGPVSFDFFSEGGQSAIPANRDFNMREGGGTVPGLMAANSGAVFGREVPVIDIETKIESPQKLNETQIEDLLSSLLDKGVAFYATTFMRHPANGGDLYTYTLKTVQPFSGVATDESSMAKSILENVERLNATVGQSKGLNFRVAY